MREFGLILGAGLFSSLLGAGFGWLIGRFAPEFVTLLAEPFPITSPQSVATAMGAIAGLGIGAAAMAVGLLASALRCWGTSRGERN